MTVFIIQIRKSQNRKIYGNKFDKWLAEQDRPQIWEVKSDSTKIGPAFVWFKLLNMAVWKASLSEMSFPL